MTKRLDEDSVHPLETAYDKTIKRMEECILNSPTMQVVAGVAEQIRVQQEPLIQALQTSLDKGTQRKTTENELPSLTQCTA